MNWTPYQINIMVNLCKEREANRKTIDALVGALEDARRWVHGLPGSEGRAATLTELVGAMDAALALARSKANGAEK